MPLIITIILVFIIAPLAKKGYVALTFLIAIGYTFYTISIYHSFDLVVMCLLSTVLFWVLAFSSYSQRRWARPIKRMEAK